MATAIEVRPRVACSYRLPSQCSPVPPMVRCASQIPPQGRWLCRSPRVQGRAHLVQFDLLRTPHQDRRSSRYTRDQGAFRSEQLLLTFCSSLGLIDSDNASIDSREGSGRSSLTETGREYALAVARATGSSRLCPAGGDVEVLASCPN